MGGAGSEPAGGGRTLERGLLTNALGIIVKASRPLYLLVFSRMLGAEGFGLYLLAFAVQEFISKLAILGLNWGVKQLVGDLVTHGRQGEVRGAVARVLAVTLLSSALVGLLLALLSMTVATLAGHAAIGEALAVFAAGFPFVCGMYVLVYSFRPKLDMRFELYVTSIIEPVGVLVLGSVFLLGDATVLSLARAHVIAAAIAFAAALYWFLRLYPAGERRERASVDWRRLAHGSAAMGGMEVVSNLQSRLDLLFLAQTYPPAVLGIYGAAGQVVSLLRKAKAAFDPILMPIAQDLHLRSDHDRLQAAVTRAVGWASYVGLGLLGLIMLLPEPLLGLFGREFSAAGYGEVLIILAIGQFFYMSLGLSEGVLAITGHGYTTLLGAVVLVALEFALLLVLTPAFGLVGAALAASLPFVVVTLWRMRQSRRLLGIELFTRTHVPLLLAWLASLGIAYALSSLLDRTSAVGLAAAAVVFLVVYKLAGWRWGPGALPSAAVSSS